MIDDPEAPVPPADDAFEEESDDALPVTGQLAQGVEIIRGVLGSLLGGK